MMTDFPSKITSVRARHFIAILMEQHLSAKFLNECIDEAMKREEDVQRRYPQETVIQSIALRLS